MQGNQLETKSWEQYLYEKIERMGRSEFERFMKDRSNTFIKKSKRLLHFLDAHNHGDVFKKSLKHEIKFINYSLCRVVRSIVIHCFRGKQSNEFRLIKEEVTE